MIFYAFVKKVDESYFDIYKIEPFEKPEAELLKIENYDMAFKISERAMNFYYQVKKDGNIIYLKRELMDFIDINDFVIFSNSEKVIQKIKETKKDIDDEDIKNEMFFEDKKTEHLKDLMNYIFPNINLFQIMNFYSYLNNWSELFTKGYVINDENKEDVFIKIIESDNDDLLIKVEKFLQEREDLSLFQKFLDDYYNLREELEYLSYWDYDNLEEALKDLEEKYLTYKKELTNLKENVKDRKNNDLALYHKLRQEFKNK